VREVRGRRGKDDSLSKGALLELLRGGIRTGIPKCVEDSEVEVMAKNQFKGKNLKQLEIITTAMSGDRGAFGAAGGNAWAKPQKADSSDLCQAIDWLLSYEWEDDLEVGQAYINAAEFLAGEALKKFKKEYAKANGVKVSQVKFKKQENN